MAQGGFCCVYLLFIAHNTRDVAKHLMDCDTAGLPAIPVLVLLELIVLVPLTWIRRLKKLRVTNLLGELMVLFGLFTIIGIDVGILRGGTQKTGPDEGGPLRMVNEDWGIFLGTAAYAYEGIGLIIPIYESYRDDLKPRFKVLYGCALMGMCSFITLFASLTYAALGNDVMSVVTLSLPTPNSFSIVHLVKILYSLALVFTYPLMLFPVIRITESKVFAKLNHGPITLGRKWLKNLFRLVVCFVTVGVALGGSNNFSNFVALIGSFCCVPLAFIYPHLIAFRLPPLRDSLSTPRKVVMAICLAFGLFAFTFCSYRAISTWGGLAEAQESVCHPSNYHPNGTSGGGGGGAGNHTNGSGNHTNGSNHTNYMHSGEGAGLFDFDQLAVAVVAAEPGRCVAASRGDGCASARRRGGSGGRGARGGKVPWQ